MTKKESPFRTDLKPLDTLLFGDEDETTVRKIQLDHLSPFKNHPFRLYSEEKMRDMAASIAEHGMMTPLIVRPHPNGQEDHYEIISGHNRHEGARQAGIEEVPVIVREVDDATAILMMISSNFEQRDELLPSEKAFAYKMQLEAIKQQGQRNDLHMEKSTSDHDGQKLHGTVSREIVAESIGVGTTSISRYIRLTELMPSILDRVDNKTINFIAAVDLSYLSKDNQSSLDELMNVEGIKTVSNAQAARLKEKSREGTLDDISIVRILHDKPEPILASIKVSKRLQEYIPPNTLPKEAENMIVSAMDIRSAALSHLPSGVSEQDLPEVLAKSLDLYEQMGMNNHSSSALTHGTNAEKEDEELEV